MPKFEKSLSPFCPNCFSLALLICNLNPEGIPSDSGIPGGAATSFLLSPSSGLTSNGETTSVDSTRTRYGSTRCATCGRFVTSLRTSSSPNSSDETTLS